MNSYFYELEAKSRIRSWQREAAIARQTRELKRNPSPQPKEQQMPLYMDVHNQLPDGATAADVAKAHEADVAVQDRYGVTYRQYWVSPQSGKVFCLVEAPTKDAAVTVHREAHGLVADELFEVVQG
jgi:hypothetical protein